MKQRKTIQSTILIALCLIWLLSACSSTSTNSNGNNKQAPEATGNTGSNTTPEVDSNPFAEKMTLNVYNAGSWARGTPLPPREEDSQRKMLEEAVNIDLQMTIPQAGEDISRLNMLLASGDIPDLIFFNDRAQAVQYYQDGIIADIDSYMDQFPALINRFTEDQWNALQFQDKTIGVPGLELVSGITGWWIRGSWLENLDLEVPTNIEQLFDVMKAFTYDDPDQNGQNDTYGFVGGIAQDGTISNSPVQGLGLSNIMWLFGVNPHKIEIENGAVVNHNTDPRMKEAVAFINRMVTEKVIDPDWVTISENPQKSDKLNRGKVGIALEDWRMMDNNTKFLEVSGQEPDWIAFPPVKGPDGGQILTELAFQNNLWAVSANAAKDPEKVERILAFLEYWYADEEAYPYFSYGEKGVFWDYDDNKKLIRLSPTDEEKAKYLFNNHYKLARGAADATYYNFKKPEITTVVHQSNIDHSIAPLPSVYLVPDESDSAFQDRMKFVNESLLRFIVGRDSLDKWDTYIQTLENTYNLKSYEENVLEQFKEQGILD